MRARCGLIVAPVVCVLASAASTPGQNLFIDDVQPRSGGLGDVITITGGGFGNDPDDICNIVMFGNVSIPLNVLDVTDNEIVAELGVVRPGAAPGPVVVALGEGTEDIFDPVFDDLIVLEPVWVWDFVEPFEEAMGPVFTPIETEPTEETAWFHSLPPENGVMCIIIEGDWQPKSTVTLAGRVREHDPPHRGHDLFAINLLLEEGGDAFHCALAICDTLVCAWEQILGDSDIACNVEDLGGNTAKITLSIPGGSIDWGNVDLCVTPEPVKPCPPDCNGDGQLDVLDFICFQQEWQNQSRFGDCNNDGVYNILDFVCYQALFFAGCDC